MAHNPAWHAEYLTLENAEEAARQDYRAARRALERKQPPAGAQARYDAALEVLRTTGAARYNFEMAGAVIVKATTLSRVGWR